MTETIETTTESDTPIVLRRKEFLARLVAETGIKQGQAAKIGEAALKVLGDALAAGEDISLPPMGTIHVVRSIDKDGSSVSVLRYRKIEPKKAEGEAADSEEAES